MSLSFLTIIALVALTYLSRRLDPSWLFPPTMFSAVWAVIVPYAVFAGYNGVRSGEGMPTVALVGSVCFFLGGLAVARAPSVTADEPRGVPAARVRWIQISIGAYAVLVVALFPLYYQQLQAAVRETQFDTFAGGVRSALGSSDRGNVSRIFMSVANAGSVLAYVAAALYDGTRRARLLLWAATLPPLLFHIFTFGRTPVVQLTLGVASILLLRRRISARHMALVFALLLSLFLGMGTLLKKTVLQAEDVGIVAGVVRSVELYFVGGPVALDVILDQPHLVGPEGLSLRFLPQLAQSLGFDVTLPDNVLDYIRDDLPNVYTFFYAYWRDFAWTGVVLGSLAAGATSTFIFVRARRGHLLTTVLFAMVFPFIVGTPIGDGLFFSMVPWLLAIAIVLVLRHGPRVALRGSSPRAASASQFGVSR